MGGRPHRARGFLEELEQSKTERERARIEGQKATIIQKYVRGFLTRTKFYQSLSTRWQPSRGISEWCYFFPHVIGYQPRSLTASQLNCILLTYDDLSDIDRRKVLQVLMHGIRTPSREISRLVVAVVEADFRSQTQIFLRTRGNPGPLVALVVGLYLSGEASLLELLPYVGRHAGIGALMPVVTSIPAGDIVAAKLRSQFAALLLDNLAFPMEPEIIIPVVEFISQLLIGYLPEQEVIFCKSRVTALSQLLLAVPNVGPDHGYHCVDLFTSVDFYRELLPLLDADSFAILTYALLKFSAKARSPRECQAFQSALAISLITTNNDLVSNTARLIFENVPSISSNAHFAASVKSEPAFWTAAVVLNELLHAILVMSSDAQYFQRSHLTSQQHTHYIAFIRSTLVLAITEHERDSCLSELQDSFLLSAIKLLNFVHLRDYNTNLFPPDFWVVDFEPTPDSIIKAAKFLTEMALDNNAGLITNGVFSLFPNRFSKNLSIFLYALHYIPYMLPFEFRASVFHAFLDLDKAENPYEFRSSIQGVINRGHVLTSAFLAFGKLPGSQFKKPLSVQFTNEFGELEAGIDGGGLTKELLTSIIDAVLPTEENRQRNAGNQFLQVGQQGLYPSSEMYFKYRHSKSVHGIDLSQEYTNYLEMVQFIGKCVGKCIYENVLVDISFTNFFLRSWLQPTQGKYSFQDLSEIDLDFYKNLNDLLKIDSEEEMISLGLTFNVTGSFIQDGTQNYMEVDLIPNGSEIPVTLANRFQFILVLTKFKLETQCSKFLAAFVEGLSSVIKPYQLKLFDPVELQRLISGGESEIDIDDLFNNVELGGFLPNDKTVRDLYDILKEFDNDSRAKFLKFVTSCPKEPLLGFKELNPKFGIRNAGRSDLIRLPTASTCVNLLKIPDYQDKKILKTKLIQSINSKSGFDLS